MDLLFFIVLVSAIVLVHELGHFMMARLFNVKVLTFSLGFGPALLTLRGRETTYRLGILPFGGFVKLLEEPPSPSRGGKETSDAEIAAEDRGRTFEAQSLPRRMMIALAGPAMNVIVPLFLFFAVFIDGGRQLPPTIGVVVSGSPADGLLRPGDRVLAIDGASVATYEDVQAVIAKSPGKKLVFRVSRQVDGPGGKSREEIVELGVVPRSVTETRELGVQSMVGRLGIGPSALAAAIGVSGPASPAYRAGLRTFDVITHVGGVATPRFSDLERRLRDNVGSAVPVDFLRPVRIPIPGSGDPLLEIAVYEPRVAVLAPDPLGTTPGAGLQRSGIESTDLYVATVPEGSSEWRAGLRPGDRILTLDGAKVVSFQAFADDLVAGLDRTREVGWSREGKTMTGLLRVRKEEWTDAAGQHVERYVWRTSHWAPTVPEPLVPHPSPILHAARAAVGETAHVVRFLVTGAVRLAQGKLTVRAISGPITIYDVAGRAGARGTRDFLWVMALISINLGLLNLLPIPTLDGGQLLYLAYEAVARKPLPLRVREVMSIAGLVLLVALMILAFRNDLGRH